MITILSPLLDALALAPLPHLAPALCLASPPNSADGLCSFPGQGACKNGANGEETGSGPTLGWWSIFPAAFWTDQEYEFQVQGLIAHRQGSDQLRQEKKPAGRSSNLPHTPRPYHWMVLSCTHPHGLAGDVLCTEQQLCLLQICSRLGNPSPCTYSPLSSSLPLSHLLLPLN